MLAFISVILIFGGIGYTFTAILAGIIRMFIPHTKLRSRYHYVTKGIACIMAGILLLACVV